MATTDLVAEIIQFGLECDDPELELLLGSAMVRAGLLPQGDSCRSAAETYLSASRT